ncbi:MAG: histidine kinase [Chitinophagaceae bacterium]|nr:histidine kinase [Chitinophagaceae bacterium]
MHRITCILAFSLLAILSQAQQPVTRIERYGIKEGLSHATVRDIMQDSRGFLWVATEWGLNRYDGKKFKKYLLTGKNGFPDLYLGHLQEGPDGKIWMQTGEGICSLDPNTEKITSYPKANGSFVFFDRGKTTWTSSNGGIAKHHSSSLDSFTLYPADLGPRTNNRYVNDFLEDRNGKLWISTSNGIQVFDRKTSAYISHAVPVQPGRDLLNAMTFMFEDSKGNLYAGTWGEGIMKWNHRTARFDNFYFPGLQRGMNWAYEMQEISLGDKRYFSLGTAMGLAIIDADAMDIGKVSVVQMIGREGSSPELDMGQISALCKDRQNNLWVGTPTGLYKIDPSRQKFAWTNVSKEALFHYVRDIRNPSQIGYATTMKGWWKINVADGKVAPFPLPEGNEKLLNFINAWLTTDSGYWFTSQEGFGFYDIYHNRVVNLSHLADGRTGGIVTDGLGRIWFTVHKKGLRVYDPSTKTIRKVLADSAVAHSLFAAHIFGFVFHDGHVWATGNNRIYKINPVTLGYEMIPSKLQDALFVDKDNRLLVINHRAVYQVLNGELKTIYTVDSLTNRFIDRITQDASGNFWAVTVDGFYKVSNDFKTWISFTEESEVNSMIQVMEMREAGNKKLALVNAQGSFLLFDYASGGQRKDMPPVVISSVLTGDKRVFFPGATKAAITIPHKSAVEIELSVLNFSNETETSIKYQLRGWDNEWKDVLDGKIRFEGLPGGNYSLHLKVFHAGEEYPGETVFRFQVSYPLWQRWWFITLAVIKQKASGQMPQLLPLLDKMGATSREMVGNMSDIVWAINPKNDDAGMLINRMRSHAGALCALKEIHLRFNSNEEIGSIKFNMEQRRNIFLVFKEALNNALKYSGCNTITINIRKEGAAVAISIEDDGKGFEVEDADDGNGLRNMRQRTSDIKGDFFIRSVKQQGTSVAFSCPLT